MAEIIGHRCLTSGLRATYLTIQMKTPFSKSTSNAKESYKFVIAGGGTGGIAMAARILGLGVKNVTIIEPSEVHYYQPYFTLIGGHKRSFETSYRPTSTVVPKGAQWIKDKVIAFNPALNTVSTANSGDKSSILCLAHLNIEKVKYDYLIVALGLDLAFDKIKGLPEAFETKGVCSNYSSSTVLKTAKALEDFTEGNAIFTQPGNPIKCAGAPQKIMYLAEEYFTKNGKRSKANIIFNTSLGVMFSCPKYAEALKNVAKNKNISVNYLHNLIEVKPESKEAIFDKLDSKGASVGKEILKYELLHITPPMVPPSAIKESRLSDPTGFMNVNLNTLQSPQFENVFGLGDCTNVPTSKTAAAVASQCGILTDNIKLSLKGKPLTNYYFGYTSCPLVTGYNKGILAEFNYRLLPEETLPIDQSKERYISYYLKTDLMPFIYWNLMLKGRWSGPKFFRKLFHLWMT